VSALPVGTTMMDLQGWQGPATYTEFRNQLSAITLVLCYYVAGPFDRAGETVEFREQ
jgi:hypothetical protein